VVNNSVDAFFTCTSPPLEVRFDEPLGLLACGTHLHKLNSSLANGPRITHSGADPAKGYVLMMIDPDAPRRAEPTSAPIRHWLVVNIPGAALRAGSSHSAARARKLLGWPKRCRLAHAFLWEHSYKRLQLAQLLGQLGVFLT
jgi:hypothetical protein